MFSKKHSSPSSLDRVPNSPTGQVLEARPDFSVQVDVNDWT